VSHGRGLSAQETAHLTARVNGIRLLAERLACFCDGLNEEHRDQFGKPVFESMATELPDRQCLSIGPALNASPGPPSGGGSGADGEG